MPGSKYSGGYLYDKTGNTLIYEFDSDTSKVQQVLNSQEAIAANVSEVSNTIGGQSLSGSESLSDYRELMSGKTSLYDVTPEPETITSFFLDGQEYVLGSSEASGVTTEQPSNPVAGSTYFDTTAGVLKVYDGTNWNVTGKEYNAGEGIEIINGSDYSAMRGPCPEGFHVPSKDEWTAVTTVWTTLGGLSSDGNNFLIALKLPKSGGRSGGTSDVYNQDDYASYWSSSTSNNATNSYITQVNQYSISTISTLYRSYALTIRGFKDFPVVPDNAWTKLYGTSIEAGGIFWSSSLGLISLSSDGTTWITIADKNLGATTVWNSGDTLSEANCGKYFQRGNNYGFPRTGTLTDTSTTQVDASDYGPGNYYYNSTFIISSTTGWDSSNNKNLRGGVTGVVTLNNAITNTGVLSVNGETGDVTNVVTGDAQYVINVSTSAPSSGTANNIITIVTD